MGGSGAPYLAAVPQDGWTGFLWYSFLTIHGSHVFYIVFIFKLFKALVAVFYTLQTVHLSKITLI